MNYKNFAVQNWVDDNILNMSPEQKLIFLYLHTSSYTSSCGIFKMHPKTMGFQIGLTHSPFESALKGLCAAFPDFVAVDWITNEVALLQYPKQLLITANSRTLAIVAKDVQQVESQELLRELIRRNSAGLSAPYLAQLRRLQMQAINTRHANILLDGDVAIEPENQQISSEIEINKYKQIKGDAPDAIQDDFEDVETEPTESNYAPRPALAENWQAAAEHLILLIENSPSALQYNLKGMRPLPVDWKEKVNERMRYFQGNGEWALLTIPSEISGQRRKWEAQMCAKVAAWIDSPYNKPKATNGYNTTQPAQVATTMRLSNPEKAPR